VSGGLAERLHSHEGQRGVFETQLRMLEADVAERDSRLAALARDLEVRAGRASELDARVAAAEQQHRSLHSQLDTREATLATRSQELDAARSESAELRARWQALTVQAAEHAERVKRLEAEAATRGTAHASEIEAAATRQRALEEQYTGERSSTQSRLAGLDSDLERVRAELAERSRSLEQGAREHAERIGLLATSESRVRELSTQLEQQQQSEHELRERLRASAERALSVDTELGAAQAAIHRLEGELRLKTARVEEINAANDAWRSTLEAAHQSLEQRDALIERLETEAAHGAALLDNIQRSIRLLDPTGTHAELPSETATRLLVRTEGDSEIVHVLGRKTSIGRTPDNDVQVDTKYISRHHAVILAGPVHTILEDLNSTNGVHVNGKRVNRQTLKDGDALVIGKTAFRFALVPTGERRAS
jgi:chromosome segregation ATPase